MKALTALFTLTLGSQIAFADSIPNTGFAVDVIATPGSMEGYALTRTLTPDASHTSGQANLLVPLKIYSQINFEFNTATFESSYEITGGIAEVTSVIRSFDSAGRDVVSICFNNGGVPINTSFYDGIFGQETEVPVPAGQFSRTCILPELYQRTSSDGSTKLVTEFSIIIEE